MAMKLVSPARHSFLTELPLAAGLKYVSSSRTLTPPPGFRRNAARARGTAAVALEVPAYRKNRRSPQDGLPGKNL